MSEIIKMSHEEFIDMLKSENIGYIKSLQNLLQMQYEQCRKLKDGLLLVVTENPTMPEDEKGKYTKTLEELYLSMQILEDKYNIIQSFIGAIK